jgi:hypothetical protein
MKARRTVKGLTLLFAAVGLTTANATLVNITSSSLPDLVTVTGHSAPIPSEPLAQKTTSQGEAQLFAWLQGQLPTTDPHAVATILTGGTSTSVGDLSSYVGDYLVVHWGDGNAGKFFSPNPGGGFNQAFYITGTGLESVTLTTPSFTGYYVQGEKAKFGTLDVGDLSFWRVYDGTTTPVPEPTTMICGVLMLLPFGASTFRMLRRRKRA